MININLRRKFYKDAKAVSPLIATLLLIAIAVAASVITYSWVMSMIGSQSTQAQTQIRIEVIAWGTTTVGGNNKFNATIRNTGSVAATLEAVSIKENVAGSTTTIASLPTASRITINVGETATYTFKASKDGVSASWRWLTRKAYVIRATTTSGFYYEMVEPSPSTAPAASTW